MVNDINLHTRSSPSLAAAMASASLAKSTISLPPIRRTVNYLGTLIIWTPSRWYCTINTS